MDRLSDLPSTIQTRIVSFLPTIEAIRTSILSTQFHHICSSLPKLHFNQSYQNSFKNIITKLLLEHDETDIQSFGIVVEDEQISSLQLTSWLNTLAQHNVRELSFFFYDKLDNLPSKIFTCFTLEKLTLAETEIELPPIIQFPNLKYICLHAITFRGDCDATIGNKLISKNTCPVLEELEIICCHQIKSLSISIPSLKYLKLFTPAGPFGEFTITMSIPSLRELFYRGCPVDFCSDTLLSLSTVFFELATTADYYWWKAHKNLLGMLNVKTLFLQCFFLEFISKDPFLLVEELELFPRLRHLHIQMFRTKGHIQLIKLLIRSLSELQTLHLYGDEDNLVKEELDEVENSQAIMEFSCEDIEWISPLKSVEVYYFRGTDEELDLVQYLYGGARVLEEMIIRYSPVVNEDCQRKIAEKLLSFTRFSSNVNLIC